jgi:flagellar FliL protein
MALADDQAAMAEAPPAQQMSLVSFLFVAVGLTVIAGAVGFFGGLQVLASVEHAISSQKEAAAEPIAGLPTIKPANVKPLPAVVTNLAGAPPAWIRLEASLLFKGDIPKNADALAGRVTEDIVAFLRTVTVKQIEGPIGFQHLSEDLNDRVRVRGEGEVQELVIQGLIIE